MLSGSGIGESNATESKVFELIGHLCSFWAGLDKTANSLIRVALDCEERQAACIATQLDPVASRIRLLKTLIVTTGQSAEWMDEALRWLNMVDGQLAPKRNRIIHDDWDFDDATPQLIDRRAKVGRSQSRQPLSLVIEMKSEASPAYIASVIEDIALCTTAITFMVFDILDSRGSEPKPLEETFLGAMPQMETRLRQGIPTLGEQTPPPSKA